ncbi:carboxypeptidase-like regulatory domain-containing protein [Terriglobus tenax]|uniref:carboxypeptidase-like regulatory domain-containing protein n=1 Tax=Terriglobus tenax TaxID=1111115 RepID=UPI0021DF557D|nr:tetratricopeptide repeat protein [Terriglobus tenax]
MINFRNSMGTAFVALALSAPVAIVAQQAPATIHGHVQNPAGQALTAGSVKLTQDRSSEEKNRKYAYTFQVDGVGNYKGEGITPGTYVAIYFSADGKSVDFIDNVVFTSGQDKLVDIDMTRKEFTDKMTPEEKKALEEFKKNNAAATAANAKVANLNQALGAARASMASKNYDEAVNTMKSAVDSKPDEPILWYEYGNALLGQADTAAAADKKAGKVAASDPDVQAKYQAAVDAYGKVKELNSAAKKPNPEILGEALGNQGTAYAKSGKVAEANASYDEAAKANPAKSKTYYFNAAATFYNGQMLDAAAAAADKAIAADPNVAMAYYIKAQALIPKATVDPKTQKIVAPPGTVEAYQQYLELDPTGAHAEEVKGILTGIGAEIKSSYKAGKKK